VENLFSVLPEKSGGIYISSLLYPLVVEATLIESTGSQLRQERKK